MEHWIAIDLTLKKYKIKASQIAAKLGRDANGFEPWLSRYRHGKSDISATALVDLLRALPPAAQLYFFSLCLDESGESLEDPETNKNVQRKIA